jgi:NTE family protein
LKISLFVRFFFVYFFTSSFLYPPKISLLLSNNVFTLNFMAHSQPHANQFHRELLRKNLTRIFGEFDDTLLHSLEPLLQWVEIGGGEILFSQKDIGDSLYFVISGRLQAQITTEDGTHKVIGEIMRGETVGEMAIFTGEPRSATIVAIRDSVLVKLSKEVFEKVIIDYPAVSMNVTKLIINRLQNSQGQRKPVKKPVNICLLALHNTLSLTDFSQDLYQKLSTKGSVYLASSSAVDAAHDCVSFAQTNKNDSEAYHQLSQWLDNQESKHEYMLYVTDDENTEWTKRCIRQADEILLIADATQPFLLTPQEEGFKTTTNNTGAPQTLILIHPANTVSPRQTREWLHLRPRVKSHYHLRKDSPQDMKRLARILSATAIGFVVAGGGAKGFAHIGVLRALEEFDIPIDFVGGTSVGAMVAAAVSFGEPSDTVQRIMKKGALFNPTKDYNWLPFISLIRGNRIKQMIEDTIEAFVGVPQTDIEDTWRTLFVVSSNYTQAREEVHTRGSMTKYLLASTAIPGVFPPVIDGDDLLVDGGTFNNFPADVMSRANVGKVIGVDLARDQNYQLNLEEIPSPKKLLQDRFRPKKQRKYRLPSLTSLLLNATLLYSAARRNEAISFSDLYFNPDVSRFGIVSWAAFDTIVEKGYEHAKEVLQKMSDEELASYRS